MTIREQSTRTGQRKSSMGNTYDRTKEVAGSSRTWNWLKVGNLKKETEGLITAAKDQALRTNVIKTQISNIRACQHCAECVQNARRMQNT